MAAQRDRYLTLSRSLNPHAPHLQLPISPSDGLDVQDAPLEARRSTLQPFRRPTRPLSSNGLASLTPMPALASTSSFRPLSLDLPSAGEADWNVDLAYGRSTHTESQASPSSHGRRASSLRQRHNTADACEQASTSQMSVASAQASTSMAPTDFIWSSHHRPRYECPPTTQTYYCDRLELPTYVSESFKRSFEAEATLSPPRPRRRLSVSSFLSTLSSPFLSPSPSPLSSPTGSSLSIPVLPELNLPSASSSRSELDQTFSTMAPEASSSSMAAPSFAESTDTLSDISDSSRRTSSSSLPASRAPELDRHTAVRSDSRNSLTLQLDSPVSESWIESFYDEALQRNADFARSHSPPTPSDSRRPKRRRSSASDESNTRSCAIGDHVAHRAYESTLTLQSRQSLEEILPTIHPTRASANNLSVPSSTADDIAGGSSTTGNAQLSAGHPSAQTNAQSNTHSQLGESSSTGQAVTTASGSPLLPEIAATTPLEEAEPPLMRYISGFLRQPQLQESWSQRDLAQDESIASLQLNVRPVSNRRGSTQRFSLGVLPAFHFEEGSADTTTSTADSSSTGLGPSPSDDETDASALGSALHTNPVHSISTASASASFRRPHLQRNTTAVSPPEESPTYSPGLERQGMFTVGQGLRRRWQYGGHRRSTHDASGLDFSESHGANTSRDHRMTLPAEPPRLSLDFADIVDSEDLEDIVPDLRHVSHSNATHHSRFDLSEPAAPHSSPGAAIARVRSLTAAAAHPVVSTPTTIDDTESSASTVHSVDPVFGSARPVPPGSERRRAEQLLSRLEVSRRIASEVQDLQQARIARHLAPSSPSTASLLPTPRGQAPPGAVSSLLSDRDTPQASESRGALQASSRAPWHPLSSQSASRSIAQDSVPSASSVSFSAATVASHASDPAPPNHLWGEVGSPSRLIETSSMAAAVQLPPSSQARRPGSLGNSNMRGPTRVSNESWMRGQGINFYDSDGRRLEAAASASAVASSNRPSHAINRVRAPPSSPAQSPEMPSPERFASNANAQPSDQAAHLQSVAASGANQRSLPEHSLSRTPEVASIIGSNAARLSLPFNLNSDNETTAARESPAGSSQINAAVVSSSRPIQNQNRRDTARDLTPLDGTVRSTMRISEPHPRLPTSHVGQMIARQSRRGSSSAIPSTAPRSTLLRDERASFSGSRSSRPFRGTEVPAVSARVAPVAYSGRRSSASSNRSIREWFQWETDIQPPSNLDDSVFEGDEEEDLREEQQSMASATRAPQPYERFQDHVAEANEGIAAAVRRLDNVRRLLDEVEENMQTRRRGTGSGHIDSALAMDQASQIAAVTRSMAQVEEQGQDLLRRISALRSDRPNASPSVSTIPSIDTGSATSLDTPLTITLSRPGPAAFASSSSSSHRRTLQSEQPVIESRSRRVRPRSMARPALQPFEEIFAEVEAEFSQRDRRRRAVERLSGPASASSRFPSSHSYPSSSSSGQRSTSLTSPASNATAGSITTGGLASTPAEALNRLDFWDNALSLENDVFSWSNPFLQQSPGFSHVSPLARLRDARGGSAALGGIAAEPGNYVSDHDFDVSYESLLALSERVGEVKERGASSAAMHTGLSLFQYVKLGATQSGTAEQETRCGICLEDYVEQDACARSNRCGHALHEVCFSAWLRRNDTCPICRQHAV